jgi:hypothetical protein
VTTLRNRVFTAVMGLAMAVLAVAPSMPAQASQTTPDDIAQVYALVNVATFIQAITTVCQQRNTELNLDSICNQITTISSQASRNGRLLIYSVNGTFPNNYPLTSREQCELGVLQNFPYNSEGGFVTGVDLGRNGISANTSVNSCGVITAPRYINGVLTSVRHVIGVNDLLNHYQYAGGFFVPTPIGNYLLPQGFGVFHVGMAIAQNCGSLGFNASVRAWCRSYYNTLAFESNTVQNYVTFNFGNVPFNSFNNGGLGL